MFWEYMKGKSEGEKYKMPEKYQEIRYNFKHGRSLQQGLHEYCFKFKNGAEMVNFHFYHLSPDPRYNFKHIRHPPTAEENHTIICHWPAQTNMILRTVLTTNCQCCATTTQPNKPTGCTEHPNNHKKPYIPQTPMHSMGTPQIKEKKTRT